MEPILELSYHLHACPPGPRFIAKARALSSRCVDVRSAWSLCQTLHRLVRALQHYVDRKEYKRREAILLEASIQQSTSKQR